MGPLVEKKKEAKEHHYLSVLNEVEAKENKGVDLK